MREFAVHFLIRKGLGPDWFAKTIFVVFDDIDHETTESKLRQMARHEAESIMERSEDYLVYGKNWIYKDIEEV
jgi:predicted KAP-like P-loop ATPase